MPPAASSQPEECDDAGCSYRADFAMFTMKVAPCPKSHNHVWEDCPYAHSGEKARRRDPSTHSGIACPAMKQEGHCPRGDACSYAHSAWEYWLHPTRFKTAMCSLGEGCTRKFCFFAHRLIELRVPTVPPGGEGLGMTGEFMRQFALPSGCSAAGGASAQQEQQGQQQQGQQSSQQGLQAHGRQQQGAQQGQQQRGAKWSVPASSGQQLQGALQGIAHEQKPSSPECSQATGSILGDQPVLSSAGSWPLLPLSPPPHEPFAAAAAVAPPAVATPLHRSGFSSPTGPSTPLVPATAQQPLLFSDPASCTLPESVWTEGLSLGALLHAFSQEMAAGTMDLSLICSLLARLLPAQTLQQLTACIMVPGSQPVAASVGPSGTSAIPSWGWELGPSTGTGGAPFSVGPEAGWSQLRAGGGSLGAPEVGRGQQGTVCLW